MPLQFELITPERVVFREQMEQITLPTSLGEITILPEHQDLVATLVAGIAHVKKQGNIEEDIAVSGGFIEVKKEMVRVLADTAERGEELDMEAIEQAKQRAEGVMRSTDRRDDTAFAAAAAALERELARYRVVKGRGLRK